MKYKLKTGLLLLEVLLSGALLLSLVALSGCTGNQGTSAKPVIYLYPEESDACTETAEVSADEGADAKPVISLYPAETQTAQEGMSAKPVDYLYAPDELQVRVELDYDGTLTSTWPQSSDGVWEVTATPDGTLYDQQGNEYSYLFWEGVTQTEYDFSQGFVVSGEETGEFLREILAEIGLTPREYNEFIVYWLPKMENNAYNLISFQGETYTDHARLTITPEPDSLLRVFMAWKALDEPIDIEPQTFETFQREGFTVVEWGGSEAK